MPDPSLWDFPNPIHHAHDPAPSVEAARRVTQSGGRSRRCGLVLELVRRFPGLTACELYAQVPTAILGEFPELQEVRRRLTDLEAAGKVRKGPSRKGQVRKTTQVTWRAC